MRKIVDAEKKWHKIDRVLRDLRAFVYESCSFCEKYRDYKETWTTTCAKCPLHGHVCGAEKALVNIFGDQLKSLSDRAWEINIKIKKHKKP